MQYTFVMPREAVEFYKDDLLNHPVGTGPYRLKRWQRNYRMEFERNPTFHGQLYPSEGAPGDREKGLLADAGKPLPFIDRVIFYNVREYYTWWQMFLRGQIFTVGISKDYFNKVVNTDLDLTPDMIKRGILLRKEPQMDVYYLGFNWEDPVVGGGKTPEEAVRHRKLRQAITCSFNQEQIKETLRRPHDSILRSHHARHDRLRPEEDLPVAIQPRPRAQAARRGRLSPTARTPAQASGCTSRSTWAARVMPRRASWVRCMSTSCARSASR